MVQKIKQTLQLIRFSHTLFALPFALASMLIASNGLPELKTFLLIVACMVFARTSAMAFNRYIDADIDAQNPRTASRHIPARILSRSYVLGLASVSGAIFICLTYFLNHLAFVLSPVALAIIWFYSITKRWTHWTQLFLGFALGISPIAAWIAVTGDIALPPLLLGVAVAFWVAGFDIFYATQDHEFDKAVGLRSLVVKFGIHGALRCARVFHLITVVCLFGLAFFIPNYGFYVLGCAIVVILLAYEHSLVKPDDLSRVDQAFFMMNGWIGIIYFAGTATSVFIYS